MALSYDVCSAGVITQVRGRALSRRLPRTGGLAGGEEASAPRLDWQRACIVLHMYLYSSARSRAE
jgi:hypothetical protein